MSVTQKKKEQQALNPSDMKEASAAQHVSASQMKQQIPNASQSSQSISPSGYALTSDAVSLAREQLDSLQKPGAYQSPWQQSLNDVINKIQNREKFSYDLNGDALYQQYKDQYITQGQQAMMDTMGQAAALTGGYGNSYAQTAGQQTYQGYLQQLNDRVPELYQLALDQYNREGEELYNQYGLYADRDNTEYSRHRDNMSDYYTDRDYLTNRYTDERDYAHQVARDAVADEQWNKTYDRGVYEFDTQFDYQKTRDEVADKQWQSQFDFTKDSWQAEFDEGVRQFDTNVALTEKELAIKQTQWKAEFDENVRQANLNYDIKVQQIQEEIRSNKVTEEQGWAKIKLAEDELEQKKVEAQNDYNYKMASLDATKKKTDPDPTPTPTPEPTKEDYSSWDGGDWEEYFAGIRLDPNGGQAMAEKTLNEMLSKGLIPTKYVNMAAIGARGGNKGH